MELVVTSVNSLKFVQNQSRKTTNGRNRHLLVVGLIRCHIPKRNCPELQTARQLLARGVNTSSERQNIEYGEGWCCNEAKVKWCERMKPPRVKVYWCGIIDRGPAWAGVQSHQLFVQGNAPMTCDVWCAQSRLLRNPQSL